MPQATIDEARLDHIFREVDGHLPHDTAANRRTLIEAASSEANFVGSDGFGNDWFAVTRSDGTQVWVQVRHGKIINGGINPVPRDLRVGRSRETR
jgi:hypothetical protein